MKTLKLDDNRLPTILVVQDGESQTTFYASGLALFRLVYVAKLQDNFSTLAWIQENQPDLIILELKQPKTLSLSLITPLKIDWLTRDIPIVVTGNRLALQSVADLDYDACLLTPYSTADLEQVICSLINAVSCQVFA
jgi:CheY-like chemotaxis protein